MTYKEKIIENIKKCMQEKGETNTSLALKINVSQPMISQLLSGKNSLTVERVEEISAALQVPPEKLFCTETSLTTEEKIILDNYRLFKKCMHKYINSR